MRFRIMRLKSKVKCVMRTRPEAKMWNDQFNFVLFLLLSPFIRHSFFLPNLSSPWVPITVLSRCWGSPAPRPRTIHVLHVHPVSSSFQFWLCPLLPKIIPSSRRMGDKKLFGCGLTESLKSWVSIWYLDKVCSHQDPLARLRKQRYTGKL